MKKKYRNALKKLADQLPESLDLQTYSCLVQGKNIPDNLQGEQDFLKEVWYQGTKKRLVKINHYRRLKKAYARNKDKGIKEYILWVDRNNINLNQYFEKLNLERVNEGITNIAKKESKSFWSDLLTFLYSFLTIFGENKSQETN